VRKGFALGLALLASTVAAAQQVPVGAGSVVETVAKLKPGQYVWAPETAPGGPLLLVINLKSQRAVLFRNGVPIGASTVSTGRPGYSTPTGVFTILQKHVEHYSSKYDNAPMPYMQRLTWGGIALHAGQLPGYPASHGCIRLPIGFAKLLYGVTKLGMTVVIARVEATPIIAPAPELLLDSKTGLTAAGPMGSDQVEWHPERSPDGPVSIVVSVADQRAIVLRKGVIIGSAPVSVEGQAIGTWAYTLRSVDAEGQHWLRISLDSKDSGSRVAPEEWQRFKTPEAFRRAVAQVVQPGTTVVVTSDSLSAGATGSQATVLEDRPPN